MRWGVKLTEATREKLRESNIKAWSNKKLLKEQSVRMKKIRAALPIKVKEEMLRKQREKARTPENRKRMKETMLRLRNNPVWMKKQKEAQREMRRKATGIKNAFYGKKHTIEARKKVSQTKKDSPLTPRGKNNPCRFSSHLPLCFFLLLHPYRIVSQAKHCLFHSFSILGCTSFFSLFSQHFFFHFYGQCCTNFFHSHTLLFQQFFI